MLNGRARGEARAALLALLQAQPPLPQQGPAARLHTARPIAATSTGRRELKSSPFHSLCMQRTQRYHGYKRVYVQRGDGAQTSGKNKLKR